ncbi:MAG TPA: glycosyltransferase family 4 protein [Vicinamibacterales bacterium]|nr:glycosyltransferase family 4 protein [Vicinamibacterales bacterium]
MRILYSAIDQSVPAAHGGSVHVTAVAEGLADLGHEVHVLVSPGDRGTLPIGKATWSALPPPLGDRRLRLVRARDVLARARALKPDVVIERYYNFGGEGILAAKHVGACAVLEVNAPIVDYPGSWKRAIDRGLIFQPLRRWRDWQCGAADLILTPSARIIPAHVPASKILVTEWGVDTTRFHPDAAGPVPFSRKRGDIVAVFAGAFRPWHGAIHLVDAIRRLHARGHTEIKAVFVGDGPELARVRHAANGLDGITLIGAVPHAQVPAMLAAADIGVAPFDTAAHPSLAHEFHWSPLKIFEYMASGLPVVAPKIERLTQIVGDDREGVLYDSRDPDGLADALVRLGNLDLRQKLGEAARARAVQYFSWETHCRQLDESIQAARRRMPCVS